MKEYIEETAHIFQKYQGKALARGGQFEQVEGDSLGERHVVIEFPSYEDALAFYNDPEYQAILPIHQANASGKVVIMEGV